MPLIAFDRNLLQHHPSLIAVDEAGRGALAGPVVAAAVRLSPDFYNTPNLPELAVNIKDSKLLSPQERSDLFSLFQTWQSQGLIQFHPAQSSVDEIETHNILGATQIAMNRAIQEVSADSPPLLQNQDLPLFQSNHETTPLVIVDGVPLRKLKYAHQAHVKGDNKSLGIAMASIVAKVTRDRLMVDLHKEHPHYAFDSHKGYGTKTHREALLSHGPTPHHRKLFLRKIPH